MIDLSDLKYPVVISFASDDDGYAVCREAGHLGDENRGVRTTRGLPYHLHAVERDAFSCGIDIEDRIVMARTLYTSGAFVSIVVDEGVEGWLPVRFRLAADGEVRAGILTYPVCK